MKRLIAFFISSILILLTIFGFNLYYKGTINDNIDKGYMLNTDQRNSSKEVLSKNIDDNTIVVLGSSELSSADEIGYPKYLFSNKDSNFKMLLVGRGYCQSFHHAINVAALSDILSNRKVVLIVSPQWFSEEGISNQAYPRVFLESLYIEMMKNPKLSKKTKKEIYLRSKKLLSLDAGKLERAEDYKEIYLDSKNNPLTSLKLNIINGFFDFKNNYILSDQFLDASSVGKKIDISDIDFDKLMVEAETASKKNCTNNDYGINDSYFDTYIKSQYDEQRDAAKDKSFVESPEYEDLELFLRVCRELDIEPMLISVPVNGRWYDYTGFPKDDRQNYYEKIRKLADKYDVRLADFSDKEYELYFLKDVMHLGEKGWVYLDEEIYNFYKE